MTTRVQRRGNSLAVRFPKSFAFEAGRTEDCPVEVSLPENRIVIFPVNSPKYSLDGLLAGVTEEDRHSEIDWSLPAGRCRNALRK